MARNETPGSVRIRTGDGNEWRFDAIEAAADYYGVNRSDAIGYACDDVVELVDGVRQVLERDDLTARQRREIAETLSTRGVRFNVETTVTVERDPD